MKKVLLFTLLAIACILAGCTQFVEPVPPQSEITATSPMTRTGITAPAFDTLPDPYSLENMQAVYDVFDGNTTLQPTDLYVRFRPQDSNQMDLLEDMLDLALFDYPLDLDIPEGVKYVDPTIPEGEPAWYYTTVKPDFVFPEDLTYEIIRACYIPEDDEIIPGSTRVEDIDVERAALERLGYVIDTPTRSGGGGGQRPEGIVTVRDDNGTDVPVVGIRVKVNSHTKIDKEVYTNVAGYYRTNKKFWQYNLKYTLVYLNKKNNFIIWDIKGAAFGRAKYKITMTKYGGNIFLTSGEAWRWGGNVLWSL